MKTSEQQVVVVSHKDYQFPSDDIYVPYFVGPITQDKEISTEYTLDTEGKNIADKNPNYCELTAQYSLWKNSNADIKGLVHYRRHFADANHVKQDQKFEHILSGNQIQDLLQKYQVILPNKRNYYIETLWSHYEHSHHIEGLVLTRQIIANDYPEYLIDFDNVMKSKSAHMFNMLIARGEVFDEYSEWLFDILGKVESQLDISDYSTYEARVYGYISELLMDVWINHNHIKYIEQPVMFMEKQNWIKKGGKFLLRKVTGGIID